MIPPKDWLAVTSSNVTHLKYHDDALHVRYRHGGEYRIPGVSPEEAESCLHASSIGKAIAALSKGRDIEKL